MQKPSRIKWRKIDEIKLRNAVRNFNAKRTRLLKQVPELEAFLPAKISTKDIKSNITTRRDFNNQINSLKRFMKKGATDTIVTKQGVKTTKYEVNEMRIKTMALNLRRRAERIKADVSYEKGTMGSIQRNNLLPKVFDVNKIRPNEWERFNRSLEKQLMDKYVAQRNEEYKQNYLKAVQDVHGNKGQEILDIVSMIPAETVVSAYYDNPTLSIDFIYDPIEQERVINEIVANWMKYI